MSQERELMHFESATSKKKWLMSVLIVSFRIRYIIYKSPRKEEKSNTDSNLFEIWLPEGKLIVNVGFPIFTSSPNTVLKADDDYDCLSDIHHIGVILIYGFLSHKSRPLQKNGCPWVIYILSAHTP